MKTTHLLTTCLLALALCLGFVALVSRQNTLYSFHHENVLGTSLELKIAAPSLAEARKAEAAVLSEMDRQAGILSSYDQGSEFSRWFRTAGQPARVSPELFEVLALFDQWRDRTGGALDASAEVVSRVWKAAASKGRLPEPAEVNAAAAAVRQTHWKLDSATRTATHLSNVPLALNSFTKSYVVDRASAAAFAAAKVSAVVINSGGDLVVRGALTEPVSIADPLSGAENSPPFTSLLIRNRAVATSGNYRRGVEIEGRRYSHIVDPRTGWPVDQVISATVVAPNPADAGALATAFSVLRVEDSRRLAASVPGVEYLLVARDGSRVVSEGWSALEAPRVQLASMVGAPGLLLAAVQPSQAAWDPTFELLINLELGRIEDPRYRRPFVAVWVEDKDKYSVKTLALWFDRDRWLPDLRSWYRADRLRAMAEGTEITGSVSSATRPPGKYTLKWDGKDNNGKLVKPGRYFVCIEAAREKGGYEILRQEMDFTGQPKQVQLTGNYELASASLDYRKTSTR